MSNEHLLKVKSGDTTTEFSTDLSDQSFYSGTKTVPPGVYKLRIEKAQWEEPKAEAKRKTMRLIRIRQRVSGPSEYEGVRISDFWLSVPIGDSATEEYQKRDRRVRDFLASIASGTGKLEQARKHGVFKIAPEKLVGQEYFAQVDDSENEGRVYSNVTWVVEMNEYSARPGPDPIHARRPTAAATSGSEPDLLEAVTTAAASDQSNGAQADSMLFG